MLDFSDVAFQSGGGITFPAGAFGLDPEPHDLLVPSAHVIDLFPFQAGLDGFPAFGDLACCVPYP
ncbi:MAG TPA: hypothetical protein VIT22_07905 [Pseudoxanthomonas sp.]